MLIPWDEIALVVFDVDGTLYDQRRLRRRMMIELALGATRPGGLTALRVLSFYRRHRETLGDQGVTDFEPKLVAGTARATGISEDRVRAVVEEWIQTRPLPFLRACRFVELPALFAGLKRNGKTIGILSDYPAEAKLAAMGLGADLVVSADHREVGILKPDPRGLRHLIARAGVTPGQTVMIGDRIERDGEAAHRAGTHAAIRTRADVAGWQTFRTYADEGFATMMR